MRTLVLSIVMIAGLTAGPCQAWLSHPAQPREPGPDAATPTAEAIVARYIEAIGGEEAIRSHTSRTDKGTMSLGGVTGEMTIYSAAPNKRVGLFVTKEIGVINQGYNGEQGWEISPQGKKLLEGEALADRARTSDFYQALDILTANTVKVVGPETFNGRPAYRLSVRHKETPAAEQFMIFDAESGLLIGRVTERDTAAGPIKLETTLSDYKEFGGVKVPTKVTTMVMGQEQVMTISSVEFDNVPPDAFDVPAELAEGGK